MNSRACRLTRQPVYRLDIRVVEHDDVHPPGRWIARFERTSGDTGLSTPANTGRGVTGISTYENSSIFCGWPSSSTSKSSTVRSATCYPVGVGHARIDFDDIHIGLERRLWRLRVRRRKAGQPDRADGEDADEPDGSVDA